MNINNLVYDTAWLNREGIASLACGNGEKAHACFKNVLEVMGYITQFSDLPVGDTASAASSAIASVTPVSIPRFQKEGFYIYHSALLFQPQPAASNPTFTQIDITLLSAAAIFNMALTYHQRAVQGRGSPGNLLRIAARMYDQCLQIVHSLPLAAAAAATVEKDVGALLLIVLNNRAHIYYEMGDFDNATQMLQRVRKLSRSMSREDAASDGASLLLVLHDDAFEEIALNVLVTCPPATAPCA